MGSELTTVVAPPDPEAPEISGGSGGGERPAPVRLTQPQAPPDFGAEYAGGIYPEALRLELNRGGDVIRKALREITGEPFNARKPIRGETLWALLLRQRSNPKAEAIARRICPGRPFPAAGSGKPDAAPAPAARIRQGVKEDPDSRVAPPPPDPAGAAASIRPPVVTPDPAPAPPVVPAPDPAPAPADPDKVRVVLSAKQISRIRNVLFIINVLGLVLTTVGLGLLFGWVGLVAAAMLAGTVYAAQEVAKDAKIGGASTAALWLCAILAFPAGWLHFTTLSNVIAEDLSLSADPDTVCRFLAGVIALMEVASIYISREITKGKYLDY
jgi:hypothetical protein